jgi:XTP/dITP diphosphohydrolase
LRIDPDLLATSNPPPGRKLREIRLILSGLPHAFVTLDDLPTVPEPEETGATFAEIARQKALYYARATALPVVAEDSGLEIDALDGAPGIYSSRYDGATYPEKFENIYAALRARGAGRSTARFVCCLALARDHAVA